MMKMRVRAFRLKIVIIVIGTIKKIGIIGTVSILSDILSGD